MRYLWKGTAGEGRFLCGVAWDDLERFVNLAFNNLPDIRLLPETQKAILDYGMKYQRDKTHSREERKLALIATECAIYTFLNNMKRLKRSDVRLYPTAYDSEFNIVALKA